MAAKLSRNFDSIHFHARFRPDAAACIDLASGERLTYRDFSDRITACALRMAEHAPRISGARIAAISRNSAYLAIIAAACERAGAIFAPLNWRLTAAELADLLRDCDSSLVIVQPEFEMLAQDAMALSASTASLVLPEDVAGAAPLTPAKPVRLSPGAGSSPCILLYTSGTTGRAKGVVITRENALFSSLNFAALARLDSRSVLLCDSPMFHTVGLVAITRTAFLQGACVVMSDRFTPQATLHRLSDRTLGVTHYFVVPQMIEALLQEPGVEAADFSRLTALFSGGGPLSPALVKRCVDRGVLLVNGFGMSEIGSGVHMPLDAAYMSANTHAVGFAAPFLEIRLTGDDGKAVESGAVGEIWVRGPSVSPGYWRQPDATRMSRSQGWFRTGDLARQQEDGAYVIVDRLKDMYISGGENVYPAEVEAVLRQIDGVADCAVIGIPDERWGEVGAAFVQRASGASLAEGAIRRACTARLARYKQPAQICFIDEIPRTGSGKARKNVLRALLPDASLALGDERQSSS